MKPTLALVGRPNVGKSTLFNQLTRSRDAIVADLPGLTRDRQYGQGKHEDGRTFVVVDTGGIGENSDGIDVPMTSQAKQAVMEADVVLFLVDGRAGRTSADEAIARELRATHKRVELVVNKTDGLDEAVALADFYQLGFEHVHAIAASHGRGVRRLLEEVLPPESEAETGAEDDEEAGIKVAILGRPNVGKSTLLNRMLGEERVVVFDMAGTTRDAIHVPFERFGKRYTLIDTAGLRRRGKVFEAVEKFSAIKALQAVEEAQVVLLVIDAREGVTDQDLHLLGYVLQAGRSLLIAVNKWDGLTADHKDDVKRELSRRLEFIPWARIHYISALHGTGVGDLFEFVERAHASAFTRLSSNQLTTLLERVTTEHQPPQSGRYRAKLRYAHMGGSNPPLIVVHGSRLERLPASYVRYLENRFRELLRLEGTPVKFEMKSGENPYADRKNVLTERQVKQRKRLMRHIKKR
jgi:GTP-binding protein